MLLGDCFDQIQIKPLCYRTVVANDSTALWIAINALRHFCKVLVFTCIANQRSVFCAWGNGQGF